MYCIIKRTAEWQLYNMDTRDHRRLELEEAAKVARKYPSLTDPKVRALIIASLKIITPNLPSRPPAYVPKKTIC